VPTLGRVSDFTTADVLSTGLASGCRTVPGTVPATLSACSFAVWTGGPWPAGHDPDASNPGADPVGPRRLSVTFFVNGLPGAPVLLDTRASAVRASLSLYGNGVRVRVVCCKDNWRYFPHAAKVARPAALFAHCAGSVVGVEDDDADAEPDGRTRDDDEDDERKHEHVQGVGGSSNSALPLPLMPLAEPASATRKLSNNADSGRNRDDSDCSESSVVTP
jgi:hypothetical protein